jgi:hypothetical protein
MALEKLFSTLTAIGCTLSLAGCGSDSATPSASGALPTNLAGQIVKGPVASASVCAYAISEGVKAQNPLVPCVISAVDGQYEMSLPGSYAGDIFIEASGGTYVDESSGKTISLSGPLSSFVAGAGPKVGIVSPLTTLAITRSASLSSAAFAAAAESVKSQAGLGADVSLTATPPTFAANARTATNAYAVVLGGISQYMTTNSATLNQAIAALGTANQGAFKDAINTYTSALGVATSAVPSIFATTPSTGTGGSIGSGGSTTPPSTTGVGPSGLVIAPEFSAVTVKLSPGVAEIYKTESAVFTVTMTAGPSSGLSYRYYLPLAPTATLTRFISDPPGGKTLEHEHNIATLRPGASDLGLVQVNVEVFQTLSGVKKKVGEANAKVLVKDVQAALISLTVESESPPSLGGLSTTILGWSFPISLNASHYIYTITNATTGKETARYRILQADALGTAGATRLLYGFCAASDLACERQTFIPAVDELTGKAAFLFVHRGTNIWIGIANGGCNDSRGVSMACDPVKESEKYPPFTVRVYF